MCRARNRPSGHMLLRRHFELRNIEVRSSSWSQRFGSQTCALKQHCHEPPRDDLPGQRRFSSSPAQQQPLAQPQPQLQGSPRWQPQDSSQPQPQPQALPERTGARWGVAGRWSGRGGHEQVVGDMVVSEGGKLGKRAEPLPSPSMHSPLNWRVKRSAATAAPCRSATRAQNLVISRQFRSRPPRRCNKSLSRCADRQPQGQPVHDSCRCPPADPAATAA